MKIKINILKLLVITLLVGCINSSDNSKKELVGRWVGESPQKKGTMCGGFYSYSCYKTIPWVRKDKNSFILNADSTGTNIFHYIRINEKDSSESYLRYDSLTYSVKADTIYFNILKSRYDDDTTFRVSNMIQKYSHGFLNGDLILKNYIMWDTGIGWTVDLRLTRSK